MKFNEYMQLGNQLEKENKILMAYSAYAQAFYCSTEENKRILKNFLDLMFPKISSLAEVRNAELKKQLMEWISSGKVSYAIDCYGNIMNELDGAKWIDAENAVLYQCLAIYQSELNYGNAPWKIENMDLEEIKAWYLKLRLMLRRIDMETSDDEEFIIYVKENEISAVALYYMGLKTGFYQRRIFLYLHNVFEKYDMKEYKKFFHEILCDYPEEDVKRTVKCQENGSQGKFAFIMAVNHEMYYEEAVYYIQRLKIPENMQIEIIPIRGAKSMTEAYNQGMRMTDAKYKIYMHQDALLVNPYMLYEICHIFEDETIGMIGVAGAGHMPESAMWWNGKKEEVYMNLYQDAALVTEYSLKNSFSESYREVEALDGVFLATQYDIPWRSDLFSGWHFYDVSQCMEFKRKQYKVVVAKQETTWCVHMGNYNVNLPMEYEIEKDKFIKEYMN